MVLLCTRLPVLFLCGDHLQFLYSYSHAVILFDLLFLLKSVCLLAIHLGNTYSDRGHWAWWLSQAAQRRHILWTGHQFSAGWVHSHIVQQCQWEKTSRTWGEHISCLWADRSWDLTSYPWCYKAAMLSASPLCRPHWLHMLRNILTDSRLIVSNAGYNSWSPASCVVSSSNSGRFLWSGSHFYSFDLLGRRRD